MGDTIPTEEATLDNSIGNNIPVHISSRRSPISPDEISPDETRKNPRVDHNCQLYTEIVKVSEGYGTNNNREIPMNFCDQNNGVLRELPIPTGPKSDSEFTSEEEEDQDTSKSSMTSCSSSRIEDEQHYQNTDDISKSIFFNYDGLAEKAKEIIKIISRPETGPGEDSSCYNTTGSHGISLPSSVDSSCCNNNTDNNSDKENLPPFPQLSPQACSPIISTPITYKQHEPIAPSDCQEDGVVEMVDSETQCLNIKKEVPSQNSNIYEESLDLSNSIYSKLTSPVLSSLNNTTTSSNTSSRETESNDTSCLMMTPNSFDTTGVFSDGPNSSLNSSSSLERNSFVSESPMGSELSGISPQAQKNDFSSSSSCYTTSCGQNSTLDLGMSLNTPKDITGGFLKNMINVINSNISVVDNSLDNSPKCVVEDFRNSENENTFSSSSPNSSSCESSPFTSILGGNDSSRYQDQMQASQMGATRLMGCCQEYDKETPRSILSRMQGVDLFIKQPFLKGHDLRQSHMTSTPVYKQQKLQESLMEMPSSQHNRSQKTPQHPSQILHTPHPKHGQLIYCHNILDNSGEFQPKTPMSGPVLNSSGEENSSPPDYMACNNASFNTSDNEERISLACLKSDLCHEDDPIRHQHNLNERKRRARITIACDLMRRLVPGLSDKTDQATVFEYAARYIHFLQTQVGNKYNRLNTLGRYSLQPQK